MDGINLTGFFAAFSRALGLFIILPLGWDIVGSTQRLSLSLAFGVFFAPLLNISGGFTLADVPFEIIAGGILGLPAALVVECAGMVGELFDTGRGQTIAQSYDPLQQAAIPLIGVLSKQASWCVILLSGLMLNLAQGFSESFQLAPAGKFCAQSFWASANETMRFIVRALDGATYWSLPFAAVFLGVEIVMAFISRALNINSLSTESFLVKSFLGSLLVLWLLDNELGTALTEAAAPLLSPFGAR